MPITASHSFHSSCAACEEMPSGESSGITPRPPRRQDSATSKPRRVERTCVSLEVSAWLYIGRHVMHLEWPLAVVGAINCVLGLRFWMNAVTWFYGIKYASPAPPLGVARHLRIMATEYAVFLLNFLLILPFERLWMPADRLRPEARPRPVLLVHGYGVSRGIWWLVRRRLEAAGHTVASVSLVPPYTSLGKLVPQLNERIEEVCAMTGSKQVTLIAHSMGGLVGKSLALRPGDAFWKAAFTVPPHELKMSDEDRVRLHDAFSWEPDPTIRRIIFIAVPHRGSEFANNPVGRIGRWLSAPPNTFRQFYERISQANPGAFTPAYAALGSGRLDSVNALAPQQPTLHILAALPFPPALQIHSIIGNRGKKGPLEQSSDGVVPYHSSHLSDVVSEKIVPAGHGCVSHSSTIAEIRRILID